MCLADRVKTLGGQSGARLREDKKNGTVVFFRLPIQSGSDSVRKLTRLKIKLILVFIELLQIILYSALVLT